MFYDLFRLEGAAGQDMAHGDVDPFLMAVATKGNEWIKQFLSLQITWAELLERLEHLGIDPDQYTKDIRQNHLDRGLLWLN